MSIWLFIGAKP